MRAKYPAILTQDEECVLVEVPDLGILTEGKNMRDAIDMARDAIGQKGITMQDHQQKVPGPSAKKRLMCMQERLQMQVLEHWLRWMSILMIFEENTTPEAR